MSKSFPVLDPDQGQIYWGAPNPPPRLLLHPTQGNSASPPPLRALPEGWEGEGRQSTDRLTEYSVVVYNIV